MNIIIVKKDYFRMLTMIHTLRHIYTFIVNRALKINSLITSTLNFTK
jgi:hypothetical protein